MKFQLLQSESFWRRSPQIAGDVSRVVGREPLTTVKLFKRFQRLHTVLDYLYVFCGNMGQIYNFFHVGYHDLTFPFESIFQNANSCVNASDLCGKASIVFLAFRKIGSQIVANSAAYSPVKFDNLQ